LCVEKGQAALGKEGAAPAAPSASPCRAHTTQSSRPAIRSAAGCNLLHQQEKRRNRVKLVERQEQLTDGTTNWFRSPRLGISPLRDVRV